MLKHDLKRQRRLHRKLNDSTHLPDWKNISLTTELSEIGRELVDKPKESLMQKLKSKLKSYANKRQLRQGDFRSPA